MKESRYNIWVDDGTQSYVYNGFSGKVAAVPTAQREPIARFLAGDDAAPADPALLHALVDGQMIIADGFDELSLLRRRYALTRRNADRFHLTVVTSLGCNFDCPYCFEAKHPSLPIYTAAIDRELNAQKFILPGLGDFGDRLYGTT